MTKTLDLVVYGATGFTGKLACQYIAEKSSEFHSKFSWAIAGRNEAKLNTLKEQLTNTNDSLNNLEVVIADCSDDDALDVLTKKSKAAISFAGPYSKYGSKLVEKCVSNCCHYADITGEMFWVKDMISQHGSNAIDNKVKLIPFCGFDSVPSDWGAREVSRLFKDKLGEETKIVRGIFWDGYGGFSGGSIASGLEVFSPENYDKTMAVMSNPEGMVPEHLRTGLAKPDLNSTFWDKELGVYLTPFIMAPINSRVVRWSNSFNNYGVSFTYEEASKAGSWLRGQVTRISTNSMNGFMQSSWTRGLVARVVPKPGTGPSEKVMKDGFAHIKYFGESAKTGTKAEGSLYINGDPGYKMTARMLVEAGIDLAQESNKLGIYGFRSPASGLSDKYFEELQKNGFDFEVKLSSDT